MNSSSGRFLGVGVSEVLTNSRRMSLARSLMFSDSIVAFSNRSLRDTSLRPVLLIFMGAEATPSHRSRLDSNSIRKVPATQKQGSAENSSFEVLNSDNISARCLSLYDLTL